MSADALAIANLKAAYCAAADALAGGTAMQDKRAALLELMLPEANSDFGHGPLTGAPALVEFLATAIASNSLWMVHMLHSPHIVVEGDQAEGRWTVMVHARRRESGAIDQTIGRYETRFARTPAGWRISHIRFSQVR